MIFSDFGKMDRPPPEGSGCTTLGPGNVPVAGVIRKGICYSPSASKGGLIGLLGGAKQILPSGGTCPPGYRYVPAQPSRPCAGGARCMMPATEARCERDAILGILDSAIPATPVSPGVPVGPLVPKDCPPGQYRPIGSAIGAPCVPLPPSTPGVAPPLPPSAWPTDSMGIPRCPPGQGANSERLPNGHLKWTCKPLPAGWQACGANMYWDQATGRCQITGSAIVNPQIAPPPPPQVAPQPVPPVTLPAPVPIPVQAQPGTAAAAAVDTINAAAQAQLAQQQAQAAQAGMGPALGIGAGGLLLLALLMR